MTATVEQPAGQAVTDVRHVSHIGLCVSDFERSLRFYTEGLGFHVAEGWDITDFGAKLAEVEPPMLCRSQMIVHGPTKLELLGWTSPEADGAALQRRNQIGLTHLSIYVDDLEAVAARLADLGGTVLEHTRGHFRGEHTTMDVVFVADPDGIRVELVQENPR